MTICMKYSRWKKDAGYLPWLHPGNSKLNLVQFEFCSDIDYLEAVKCIKIVIANSITFFSR